MVVTSRFNATDLSKLLKKPNACVFLRKCKRHLALAPKALNNINDSVFVHLNRLVRKFDPELDAVVLGSRNVSILTNLGTIMDDSPHVHIDIEAEFYLFKPEKDIVLSGVVNKKSRDFIGCLVHDIFNVSIPIEPDDGIDIDNINIGETLTFSVVLVDFSHPIPFIKGKLLDSREQSPSKRASGGKKRKRSDQLEASKKIKSEVDSPFSAEDNVNNTFSSSIKFPTSILKKATTFGVESSPARRISFYGDIPRDPTEETNITEDKAKKKKKKKKKESETSPVEESPPQRKKKKSVTAFGNEPETETVIQDSEQIDNNSSGKQKLKKKKSEQSEQDNDFASVSEHDLNILQNFKDLSKKKKNHPDFESNSFNLTVEEEISKEINDHLASPLKTKKKKKKHKISEEAPRTHKAINIHEKNKKQESEDENEPRITGENYQDQEHESPPHKKLKKSKKTALKEQEKRSDATGKDASEEKAQGSPHKRKKNISEGEGETEIKEINVAGIIDKTTEDAIYKKKNKKKGMSEVDVQQNESSVPLQKKQKPNFTNEIEPRKKSLGKGKKDPLQILTSLPELSATQKEYPQVSILQAAHLTPEKKKKSKKASQVQVSDPRVHEYLGKKDKFAVNPKTKSVIHNSTITGLKHLKENQCSEDANNSFDSLSPIEKSDGEEDEHLGFITSTQIEGPKTKQAFAKKLDNVGEVFRRNSDSDSFDVEEFSLKVSQQKYQNMKQKEGSKDHRASLTSLRERSPQSSSDSLEVTNFSKVPTKPGKHADTGNSSNSVDVPGLSPFTANLNTDLKTVQSKNQKSHLKSSGADSSSSDSEGHSDEQHNMLQESRIKSSKVFSPESVASKGVQTDEESDTVTDSELAAAKEKKMHSSVKQMKVQGNSFKIATDEISSQIDNYFASRLPLTSTELKGNESSDGDSYDSDLPSFIQKPAELPLKDAMGYLSHEPLVSSSKGHEKGTRKPKTPDKESQNIAVHLSPQKRSGKSPAKKNTFPDTHKSLAMDSNTSDSDSSLSVGTKMITQKQAHASNKKLDSVSSSPNSNLLLSKAGKPVSRKQVPVSHKKHDSDSSSSDSDLPLPKAAQTTQKQVPVSHKKHDSDSSSSDSDLSSYKAAKTTQKQVPVSHEKHDSDSSSSDSDLPSSKAAKTTQKQVPVSHEKHDSDSSSSDSSKDLPLPKAVKLTAQKLFPDSHKKHDSDSSSSDSDLSLTKATKTTQNRSFASNKKWNLQTGNAISDLSSHLKTKIPPVVKKEPLSPHKSFSSVGKKSSERQMSSQGDSKISTTKKKDTKISKRTKQQSESNENKRSGSETSSIVKGLLEKIKTEVLTPLELSSKTGKTEGKKASKESDDASSFVQTHERKERKNNISKKSVDSSKHSKKSDVTTRKKHKLKETPAELSNLAEKLLKKL